MSQVNFKTFFSAIDDESINKISGKLQNMTKYVNLKTEKITLGTSSFMPLEDGEDILF